METYFQFENDVYKLICAIQIEQGLSVMDSIKSFMLQPQKSII